MCSGSRFHVECILPFGMLYHIIDVVVVVDLPLLRVTVERSDNPVIQSSPTRRPFHLDVQYVA